MDPVLLAPGCLSPSGSSRQDAECLLWALKMDFFLAHFSMWFLVMILYWLALTMWQAFTFKVAYLQNPIYISILEMKRASSREVKEIAQFTRLLNVRSMIRMVGKAVELYASTYHTCIPS